MLSAAAAVLSLLCAQAASDAISLGEKKSISFLLITPTGNVASTSSSELIRIVSGLLAEHTDLAPVLIDAALVADCKGRVACFARARARGEARLMLVMSNLTADRLSIFLVDTDAVQRIIDDTPRDIEDFENELEARITDNAMLARPKWAAITGEQDMRNFIERSFDNELKSAFERTGNWEPYGAIELAVEPMGMAIELDGVEIGTTRAGRTRIELVSPGKRALKLKHPAYETYATEVIVERGGRADVMPELVAAAGLAPAMRTSMFWSGIILAAAGAAVTTVAIARQDGSVETFCVSSSDGACTARRSFQTASYDPDAAPTFEDQVNRSGVLLAPAGYSLIAVGGAWTALAAIFEGDPRAPWIELAGGVVLGALAYGISAAVNP